MIWSKRHFIVFIRYYNTELSWKMKKIFWDYKRSFMGTPDNDKHRSPSHRANGSQNARSSCGNFRVTRTYPIHNDIFRLLWRIRWQLRRNSKKSMIVKHLIKQLRIYIIARVIKRLIFLPQQFFQYFSWSSYFFLFFLKFSSFLDNLH